MTRGGTHGVRIHHSEVIIGRVGIGNDRPLTVIGDLINTAARPEKLTERLQAKILVSDEVWRRRDAKLLLAAKVRPVRIRGRSGQLGVVALSADGRLLAGASIDGKVWLWEASTGTCLRTLRAERRYERLDITALTGVTEAQRQGPPRARSR
jgi:hypothetical protein